MLMWIFFVATQTLVFVAGAGSRTNRLNSRSPVPAVIHLDGPAAGLAYRVRGPAG